MLYRTAVLHAAVALAAPRLRLQEAARGIDEGAGGVFHPQTFIASTADIARAVAGAHGRHVAFTRLLDPLVRRMGRSGTARRAFGSFYYREDMADHGFAPGALSLEECVRRTEEGHG